MNKLVNEDVLLRKPSQLFRRRKIVSGKKQKLWYS